MINGQSVQWEEMEPSHAIEPGWVVRGKAEEASKMLHVSKDHKFIVQIWECRTAVELDIDGYPVDEFITIISGDLELIDSQSGSKNYGPGDSLIIAKGFCGRWIQEGALRKYSTCYLG